MKFFLPLGVAVLNVLCTLGSAQKLDGLKGEVELITEPRPGNEFVQIHTTNGEKTHPRFLKQAGNKIGSEHIYSKHRDVPIIPAKDKKLMRLTANQESNEDSAEHEPEMHVSVIDEGKTGFEFENADEEEKKILDHKIEQSSEQDFEEPLGYEDDNKYIDNVSLYMESKSGIQKSDAIEENDNSPVRQLSTSKPLLEKPRDKHPEKKATEKKYDILTFNKQKNNNKKYEENFDFVDSPFEDKLVSSGTSQTSRINVKKGPNGQDYEYEYVYYYYDENDDKAPQTDEAPKQRPSGRVTTTPEPVQTSWRQPLAVATPEPPKAESPRTRGRPSDNTRYTISGSNLEQDLPTEKISNELLSAVTTPSRIRGRPQTTEVVSESAVTEGTRFPSRSRGSTTTPFVSSTPSAAFEASPARTRGNIRRPSLELVDSSSFRTYSSNASPDQDQNKPTKFRGEPAPQSHVIHSESFTTQPKNFDQQSQTRPAFANQRNPIENTIPSEPLQEPVLSNKGNSIENVRPQEDFRESVLETTRESDLEEFVPQTDVPTTGDLSNTVVTRPRGQFATDRPVVGNTGMPDKAAFDLYAIMQQIHNEESNYLTEDNSAVQVDQNGLPIPFTVVEFPTTTISSTTTTTVTTTTPTTTAAPTTTPTPAEEVLPGKRFKSNLSQRNRFKTASSTTTTEVPAEQSTLRSRQFQPTKTRPQGQQSAYARRSKTSTTAPSEEASSPAPEESTKPKSRFGSRNRFGSGASTTSAPSSSAAPVEKPASRSSGSSGFSSRRRPGSRLGSSSTTSAEGTESSSTAPESAQPAASTPSPRARLPGSNVVRPLRPGPRINIGGPKGRLGLAGTTSAPEENKSTAEGVSPDGSVSESAPQPQKQQSESEVQAESIPADQTPSTTPDALTRLRNRPRLQPLGRPARPQPAAATAAPAASTPAAASGNTAAAASPIPNRRALGGLLGRQRPGQTTSTAASPAPVEEEKEEVSPLPEGEASPITEASPATTENKISSLISRRRNIAARRPGTIQTRSASKETL